MSDHHVNLPMWAIEVTSQFLLEAFVFSVHATEAEATTEMETLKRTCSDTWWFRIIPHKVSEK
jgi:hypothetical protein